MAFIRKLRKNKFVVLAIIVIALCLAYTGVRKAINNYMFEQNKDIVGEEKSEEKSDENMAHEDRTVKSDNENYSKNGEQFEGGETDLELEEELNNEVTNGEEDNISGSARSNSSKIYIYITGEVNVPGVVILNEGSRIVDAINAAGGTTAKANVTKVNLVYVLEDGMKVNIPNDNDLKNNPDFEYITLNSGDGGREDYSGGTSYTGSSSSNGSNLSTSSGTGSEKKYSIVNINTATQTELETLPGIGPSLALKIINYRKENGKFSTIEEIKNVSGIGESKFEDLKRYITV